MRLDETNINKSAEIISKLLVNGQSLMNREEYHNGTEEVDGID